VIGLCSAIGAVCWDGAHSSRFLAAQQMPACREQIGQRAGHKEAMSVLRQSAIAHLGEAEHPLDDPDRMLDVARTFDLVRFFARSSTTPR